MWKSKGSWFRYRGKGAAQRNRITTLEQLIKMVDEQMQKMLQSNLQELHLRSEQIQLLNRQKKELKQMLKKCGIGDKLAKQYVKQTIREILTEKLCITEEEMEQIMPRRMQQRMTERDMFEYMLQCYRRKHGMRALAVWLQDNHLDVEESQDLCKITGEQIRHSFGNQDYRVDDEEWLELIVQRVYAEYRGLGVIDDIRDMDIDGVSGGVNGRGEEERSVWIMFHGKSIYLSFLCFGSEKNLQRICRTIYRHGQSGQLSKSRGYIVNEMADHARVVVARPDFCEHWVFFVRKLDNLDSIALEDLYQGKQADAVVCLLQYIVKGCQTIAITGSQGSGKTTLLMSLIAFIPASFTLRIQETAFELQLRRLYPERNIVSFRETGEISAQEGLDLQKKTDGTVSIIGEVASARQAALMLQLGQTASLYTMFTHHANSTRNLVAALQNNLLQVGQFTREEIARRQVVEVVRFHVHLEKGVDGTRYISYITEIVPKEAGDCFEERILLRCEAEGYQVIQNISKRCRQQMASHMARGEQEAYDRQIISYVATDTDTGQPACPDKKCHTSLLSGK